jgi:hypothetical protein
VVQSLDEGQGVADGGQQDVAAGLVRLRLEGEAQVVAAVPHVAAEEVDRLEVAVVGVERGLGAPTSDPSAAPQKT